MGFAAGQRKRDEEGCIGYPGTGGRHLLELLCFLGRTACCCRSSFIYLLYQQQRLQILSLPVRHNPDVL